MAKEMEFFSFLMEQYAAYKGTTANKINLTESSLPYPQPITSQRKII